MTEFGAFCKQNFNPVVPANIFSHIFSVNCELKSNQKRILTKLLTICLHIGGVARQRGSRTIRFHFKLRFFVAFWYMSICAHGI